GIGIEGIRGNAIAHAPRVVIEEVRHNDFEVIPGCVSEGAPTVAVAQCPDARDIGVQPVVDFDVATGGRGDSCFVETKIVRVRPPADGEQDMGAADMGALPPTLIKILSAVRISLLPSTLLGPTKRAWPSKTVHPLSLFNDRSTPSRDGRETASLRALTAFISTPIEPPMVTP